MKSKERVALVQNIGLLELERVIVSLYSKGLTNKNEIKELISSLKLMVDNLPEKKETYLN